MVFIEVSGKWKRQGKAVDVTVNSMEENSSFVWISSKNWTSV